MKLSELEKEVIGLSKSALSIVPYELVQSLKWQCVSRDVDVNMEYEDDMTIGDVVGRFQVYHHYALEMINHWDYIVYGDESTYPDWAVKSTNYQGDTIDDIENLDWEKDIDEDGNEIEMAGIFGYEVDVYCEWGQHWVDTTTGEVVFLGKPHYESGKVADWGVGHDGDPFIVIRPDGETAGWFNRFDTSYGNLHHYDYHLHENLIALGHSPLDTMEMDYEYDDSEFNDWYHKTPWHVRIMKADLGVRDENEEYEKIIKIGGLNLLIKINEGYKCKEEKEAILSAYKIRLRNKYVPDDEDMWYRLVWLLYSNKKDYRNAHYVCPADLNKAIDAFYKKSKKEQQRERDLKEKRIAEEEIAKYEKCGEDEEKAYAESHGKYIKIEFEANGISYKVLHNVKAFLDEGLKMHHCVYHHEYFKHKETVVLSATIDGKRVETLELDLLTGKVLECFGIRNTFTPFHEQILSDVEGNASLYTDVFWASAV